MTEAEEQSLPINLLRCHGSEGALRCGGGSARRVAVLPTLDFAGGMRAARRAQIRASLSQGPDGLSRQSCLQRDSSETPAGQAAGTRRQGRASRSLTRCKASPASKCRRRSPLPVRATLVQQGRIYILGPRRKADISRVLGDRRYAFLPQAARGRSALVARSRRSGLPRRRGVDLRELLGAMRRCYRHAIMATRPAAMPRCRLRRAATALAAHAQSVLSRCRKLYPRHLWGFRRNYVCT